VQHWFKLDVRCVTAKRVHHLGKPTLFLRDVVLLDRVLPPWVAINVVVHLGTHPRRVALLADEHLTQFQYLIDVFRVFSYRIVLEDRADYRVCYRSLCHERLYCEQAPLLL